MVSRRALALMLGAFAAGLLASRLASNEPVTPTIVVQTRQLETEGGVTAYLGLVPAEILRGLTMNAVAERNLHGHMPRRPHEYQVLVALFNTATGARISDAVVSVELSRPGSFGGGQKLEPIQIAGAATYGGIFDLPEFDLYSLKLTAERAGTSPIVFQFSYDHRP